MWESGSLTTGAGTTTMQSVRLTDHESAAQLHDVHQLLWHYDDQIRCFGHMCLTAALSHKGLHNICCTSGLSNSKGRARTPSLYT